MGSSENFDFFRFLFPPRPKGGEGTPKQKGIEDYLISIAKIV
jgi:hypothetical protein